MISRDSGIKEILKIKFSSVTCGYESINEIPIYGTKIDIFSLYSEALTTF